MAEDRRDVRLTYVLDMQHPWEHDFNKHEASDALKMLTKTAVYDSGYSQVPVTIGWYEDNKLRLQMRLPTNVIDIIEQLIEHTHPSEEYDKEYLIGGQHAPPEHRLGDMETGCAWCKKCNEFEDLDHQFFKHGGARDLNPLGKMNYGKCPVCKIWFESGDQAQEHEDRHGFYPFTEEGYKKFRDTGIRNRDFFDIP